MRRVYKDLCTARISISIMAANMWKNSLKNVESDNNKILYETLLDFFYSETVLSVWISIVCSWFSSSQLQLSAVTDRHVNSLRSLRWWGNPHFWDTLCGEVTGFLALMNWLEYVLHWLISRQTLRLLMKAKTWSLHASRYGDVMPVSSQNAALRLATERMTQTTVTLAHPFASS